MEEREKLDLIRWSPYFDVFALIAAEGERSLGIHGAWDNLTPRAMHALTGAELGETAAAIEMGLFTDAVREFVHTGNTACKAATELIRRGDL